MKTSLSAPNRADTYSEKTILPKDTCISIVTAALFTIVRTWKQPKCPSTEKWIKKMWYIYTMQYYSVITLDLSQKAEKQAITQSLKKKKNSAVCSIMAGPKECNTE